MRIRIGMLAWAATLLAAPTPVVAQQPELSVPAIFGSSTYSGDLVPVQWSDDARYFTMTESGSAGTDIYHVDARTGARQLVVRGSDLVPAGATEPIAIEGYQFSADGGKLLIFTNSVRVWRQNTKGEYYVWDLGSRKLTPISTRPGYQLFAKFSPDGRLVGFVRDHNIFVSDLAAGTERQLTTDGSDDIINGTSDWVYEEELNLRDAFRFSPDGSRVAFWRLDQSAIEPFYLIDDMELYPQVMPVRYPKAGTANSEVRIGVADLATGATRWVDLGADQDIYIADMDFAGSADELWLTRLNRHQNRLDLVLADARTGQSRVVMSDRDSAWVEAATPTWVNEGKQFLFPSERDGFRQFYLFARDGRLVRRVTPGGWDVTGLYGVDEKNGFVYFGGVEQGPTTRQVYRVGLDGKGFTRVSQDVGSHTASFNADATLWVDVFSTAATPPTQTLRQADGTVVRVLADNAELNSKIAALDLAPPEFLMVPGADGTPLQAYLIKPKHFDPTKRYPLLMYVYGGPGSQTVTNGWGGSNYLWYQMLARAGYLVASVDNRGTGSRGRRFEKQTYLRLGQLESDDQIAAAKYFASLPYVDGTRIGIWGWSYGGYMTLMSLFRGEGVFKTGLSVAPVTDWRFYDTIYTERFMRTPRENPEGYEVGSPINHVDQLQGRLLVVHGTGDDNVHFQNTVQLVQALEEADKQFDMRIYPNKTHSIAGRTTRVNLYTLFTEWLARNL